ncbi:MAG: hypothetical protein A2341_19300 [Deltaproteobacteria bacterium RIFOXYB12_FULL_58_9]|nr:MAG: hypothetical protein A2341_19300 [Deltaproteobacteria bacterium RIFOXYB12_FULL_58_9]
MLAWHAKDAALVSSTKERRLRCCPRKRENACWRLAVCAWRVTVASTDQRARTSLRATATGGACGALYISLRGSYAKTGKSEGSSHFHDTDHFLFAQ